MKGEGISENLEWKLIGCSKGYKVDATSRGIYACHKRGYRDD